MRTMRILVTDFYEESDTSDVLQYASAAQLMAGQAGPGDAAFQATEGRGISA